MRVGIGVEFAAEVGGVVGVGFMIEVGAGIKCEVEAGLGFGLALRMGPGCCQYRLKEPFFLA